MSVIGFDIGNESCVIAAAKRGGIDVLLNDESKRETPAVVSFGEKQRFLGCAGAAFATANPKSTISQIKRLIGRLYNEPSVQEDLKLLPFATSEGPRGGVLIELEYLKRKWTFTPVEILGMLFTHLKQITEKNLESPVVDCVIGIPSYFTDLQRREYLDAASIAGLKPMMLMHDCTAIALGYGMYKTDLSNSRQTNVMFVDVGQCDTQVTIAAFKQGEMKILSHSFDQNLGGRDFDEVLFKHFAVKFQEEYKINVFSSARACIRLRASCEKLKKVLSANAEAPISIECLIEDTDVKGFITREEFENLSLELLQRVTVACDKALNDSGLSVDKIYTIELVGSGSRIPAITRFLTFFFQKEPTRTLNASECVARGCALRCAMLSPTLQVRNYKVQDLFPYSIAIPLDELKGKKHQEYMLFPKRSPFPCNNKVINDGKRNTFYFQVSYSDDTDIPAGVSPIVGHFWIGPSETSAAEEVKIEFEVKINDNGIVEIGSASLLEYNHASVMNYFFSDRTGTSHMRNLPFSENLDVATTNDELHKAQEREKMLAEQDMKVEQTKDQRNTLESFVYDTRSKLSSAYQRFASDSEKEVITKVLQETEDWLYEDSDDDESEQDYTGKLQDLKKLLEPVENKYKEEIDRAKAVKAMQTCIAKYLTYADSLTGRLKKEVQNECNRVEKWLDGISQQRSSPQSSSSNIIEAMKNFERCCKNMIRPKASFPRHEHVDSDKRDQRETIKLFISDTRRKLSSASRSFATESDINVITNILKETEDWLYQDSDDEPKQGYTGKLEYLIKFLEPFEIRYREENVRAKAAKALQMSIVKYRVLAASLAPGQKEKIKKLCNEGEKWLNDNYRQHSSPESLLSDIIQVRKVFESECINIMRPKSAFPKHDEVQDSDQMDQSVDSNHSDQPVDSNRSDKPVDLNQSDQPVYSNQSDQPVDLDKSDQPVDMNESDQAADSNQRDATLGFKQKGPIHGFKQKGPACEVKQKGPTCEDKKKEPTHGFEQKGAAFEVKQKGPTSGLERKGQTYGFEQKGPTRKLEQKRSSRGLEQKVGSPSGLEQTEPTHGIKQKGPTRGLEQKGSTHGLKQKGPTYGSEQKGPPADSN